MREFTDTGGPTARCQRKSQLSLSDKILIGVKSHKRPTTAERLAAWQLSVLPLSTTQIPPLYRIGCPAAWLAILLARSHCWLTILRMLLYHLTSPSLVPAFTLTAPTHPQWLLTSIEANLFRLLAEVVNYITDILKSSLSIPAVSSVVKLKLNSSDSLRLAEGAVSRQSVASYSDGRLLILTQPGLLHQILIYLKLTDNNYSEAWWQSACSVSELLIII